MNPSVRTQIIPCFSSIPVQGAFHFPMENKGKESCYGHFPVLVSQRPLFFISQEYRAVPLVGLDFGKIGLILNQHSPWEVIGNLSVETEEDTRIAFPEAAARTVLVSELHVACMPEMPRREANFRRATTHCLL